MNTFNICFVLLFSCVSCKIPDYIELCSKTDTNVSECLLKNINRSIKRLAIDGEPIFKIPNITKFPIARLAMQTTPDLQVDLRDLMLIGMSNIEIREISMSENELYFKAFLPRLEFIGTYTFDGKLLILTLKSSGDMNITQIGVEFDYNGKLLTEERRGKKYYYVSSEPDVEAATTITSIQNNAFNFGNLFPNDPRIGTEMNIFLNENWREVYKEVNDAMQKAYSWYFLNPIINGFLRHIPIDDLYQRN